MNCISQVIQFFVSQVKSKIITTDDAYQISEKLTPAQVKNGSFFNISYKFYDFLSILIKKTSIPRIQENLQKQSIQIVEICNLIINAVFSKETNVIEKIILSMHGTDYNSNALTGRQNEASRFVQILQKHVLNFCNFTLSAFSPCSLIDDRSIRLTQRTLIFFVRNASLVRPLSDAGKLRLAGDMAQLESAITPLVVTPKVCCFNICLNKIKLILM